MSSRSGTPESFAVKAIVPLANAAKGRPEGANVTERVSTISTYISFEVCRTFARLQGIAGVLAASTPVEDIPDIPELDGVEKPGFLGSETLDNFPYLVY